MRFIVVVLVLDSLMWGGFENVDGSQEGILSRRDQVMVAWQFIAWNVSKKKTVP